MSDRSKVWRPARLIAALCGIGLVVSAGCARKTAPGARMARPAPQVPRSIRSVAVPALENALAKARRLHRQERFDVETCIAGALAMAEPDRALEVARSVGWRRRQWALAWVAGRIATSDPDRAFEIAASLGDERARAMALVSITRTLQNADATEALRTSRRLLSRAREVADEPTRMDIVSEVAKAVGPLYPRRGQPVIERAVLIAQSIRKPYLRGNALAAVLPVLAKKDADRAIELARAIRSAYWRALALGGVAVTLSSSNPRRSRALIDEAAGVARASKDSYLQTLVRLAAAEALAHTAPARAVQLAQRVEGGELSAEALARVAIVVAETDPDRALAMLDSLKDKPNRWRAANRLAGALAKQHLDRALEVARSIDPQFSFARTEVLATVALAVARSQPKRAAQIAEEAVAAARHDGLVDPFQALFVADAARVLALSNPRRATDMSRLALDVAAIPQGPSLGDANSPELNRLMMICGTAERLLTPLRPEAN